MLIKGSGDECKGVSKGESTEGERYKPITDTDSGYNPAKRSDIR